MINIISKLRSLRQALQSCRDLHITHFDANAAAYEGPGKTTISFISKEIGHRLLVTHCDQFGFTLNTGIKIIGPTVLFPRHALCWNITSGKHINDETLSLFTILEPKPDLLIIGLDDKYDFTYIKSIQNLVQKYNINTEIVAVLNACTVYNFVNEEGRYVIAALIPPKSLKPRLVLPKSIPRKQITYSSGIVNNKTDSKTTNTK